MSLISKIEQDLKSYYAQKADAPDLANQMGWKSKWAQEIRFVQLLKIIEEDDTFSINDLGCGNGYFLDFIKKNFPNQAFHYFGYDIMPEMIAEANKLHPNNQDNFKVISSASDMEMADYTVASGILNLKYKASNEEWLDFIHETISTMWAKSNKGVAFNCLTSYSDKEFMRPELYYTDSLAMFDFCQKNFTRHIALLHDYREYDFTLLLRK